MAVQKVNIGAAPNDGSGDSLRLAFQKMNNNADELIAAQSLASTAEKNADDALGLAQTAAQVENTPQGTKIAGLSTLAKRRTALRVGTAASDSTGSFGDNTTSPQNHNISSITGLIPGSGVTKIGLISAVPAFFQLYYPGCHLVFNGGIGGQDSTKILARDTLAAGINRKAISDAISAGLDVILHFGVSINNISPITAGTYDSVMATVRTNYREMLARMSAAGVPIITNGCFGYSAGGQTALVQQAIVQLDTELAAIAADFPLTTFISWAGITHNNGAFIAGMSADGTHLRDNLGGVVVGNRVAHILNDMFGESPDVRYQGTNLASNPLLVNSTGGIATGYSAIGNGASNTVTGPAIEVIAGKKIQTFNFNVGSENTGLYYIEMPFDKALFAAGDTIGIELDVYVSASEPVMTETKKQLRLRMQNSATPTPQAVEAYMAYGNIRPQSNGFIGKVVLPPVLFTQELYDAITTSNLRFYFTDIPLNSTLKAGVGNLRIVKQ